MSVTSGPTRARHPAFTLVELLVVIGIIAVLVSILLPVLGRAREQAQRVRCASNLRQFALADEVYVNETKGWHLPGFWDADASNPDTSTSNPFNRTWPGIFTFRKFLDMPVLDESTQAGRNNRCYVEREKWYCPTMDKDFTGNNITTAPDSSAYFLPINYSYGMNVTGVDVAGTPPNGCQAVPAPIQCTKGFHGYNRAQVKHPSDKLMFVDGFCQALVNVYGSGVYPGWNGKISNYDQVGEQTTQKTSTGQPCDFRRMVAWRHRGGANVCYFDGHVQWLKKDFIYKYDASGNIAPNWDLWDVMDLMH